MGFTRLKEAAILRGAQKWLHDYTEKNYPPTQDQEFEALMFRAREMTEEARKARASVTVPQIVVDYEEIPGWWQCIDERHDPPCRVGDHYNTQAEAYAFRAGFLEGWANE